MIECALSEVNALFPGLRGFVGSANEKHSQQLQQKAEKDKKKKRKRQEEKKAERREGLDFS